MKRLPIYGGVDAGARPAARDGVAAAVEQGAPAAVIVSAMGRAIDALWSEHGARGLGIAPACARGCSSCCHQRVELTAPEVIAIAPHVSEPLRARVRDTAQRLAGIDGHAHHLAQIPCAFLVEDACAIHEVRPLACRRAHSTNVEICRAVHADPTLDARIPDDPTLAWNTAAVVIGYREGYEHAGRPLDVYELHGALAIAFDTPDAEARCAAGDDPFATARTRTHDEVRAILSGR